MLVDEAATSSTILRRAGLVQAQKSRRQVDGLMSYPEGTLLREQGHAEVFWIRDGERVWIPNPYVMSALSLDWGRIQEVPAGSLDPIPRDTHWDVLAGRTPGSTVFVPSIRAGVFGANGKVWYAVPLQTTKKHVAWGEEVRTIELRGWISARATDPNGVDPDFSYDLELDVFWARAQGIDLNQLIRVGNILQHGVPEPGITDPRAWCATPMMHMEISGFPPKGQWDRPLPPDWANNTAPACTLVNSDAGALNGTQVVWPFDPMKPFPTNREIALDEYARVYGSIVNDKAHGGTQDPAMSDAVSKWQGLNENWFSDDPRWNEIHPPDWIEVMDFEKLMQKPPAHPVVRGVAVVAPGTFWFKGPITTTLDVDIKASPKPDPTSVFRFEEIVGPETTTDLIVEGNATKTGALITPLASGDGIHVHVKVAGRTWNGASGKFRALYLLYWDPAPPPRPHVAVPDVIGQTGAHARARIEAAGLRAFIHGPSGPNSAATEQHPAAGTMVAQNTIVSVTTEV